MTNVRTMTVAELELGICEGLSSNCFTVECANELSRRAALLDRLEAVVRERRVLFYEVSRRDCKAIGCETQHGDIYDAPTLRAVVEAALEAKP